MERIEPEKCCRESSNSLTAEEAFSLIGDETRVTILEALWQVDEQPVPFSTLYEMVDTDTSAQFNYHLDQLTGHFVHKSGDGYTLRTAGENVVRAIVEGSFTAHPTVEPFQTGDDCVHCGEQLVAKYRDEKLGIDCPACARSHGKYSFPPGGLLDRTPEEILRAFDHHVRHLHSLATEGVCPECRGRTRVSLLRDGDFYPDVDVSVGYTCEQCQHRFCSPIGLSLIARSPVTAFYRDHGYDIRSIPYWQLDWCLSDEYTTIHSTNPWQLTVTIPLDGEQLAVDINDDLRVTGTERYNVTSVPMGSADSN